MAGERGLCKFGIAGSGGRLSTVGKRDCTGFKL